MTTPSSTLRRAFRSRAAGGDCGGGGRAGGDSGGDWGSGGRGRWWWRRRMRIVPMMGTMKTVTIRNYEDHEPREHCEQH